MKYEVTLKQLLEANAPFRAYNRVVRVAQDLEFTKDDELRTGYLRSKITSPISLIDIADDNLKNAVWCLRLVPGAERDARMFAIWYTMEAIGARIKEEKIAASLLVAAGVANGSVSDKERIAAYNEMIKEADVDPYHFIAEDVVSNTLQKDAFDSAMLSVTHMLCYKPRMLRRCTNMFLSMCDGVVPW